MCCVLINFFFFCSSPFTLSLFLFSSLAYTLSMWRYVCAKKVFSVTENSLFMTVCVNRSDDNGKLCKGKFLSPYKVRENPQLHWQLPHDRLFTKLSNKMKWIKFLAYFQFVVSDLDFHSCCIVVEQFLCSATLCVILSAKNKKNKKYFFIKKKKDKESEKYKK